MTDVIQHPPCRNGARDTIESAILSRLAGLDDRRRFILLQFLDQIVSHHDPDVIEDFIAWRSDPMIESLLQLAAAASAEMREQLLFTAEQLYSDERLRS